MRLRPNGAEVLLLMFSGYCEDDSDRESVAVRADALLCKPVLPRELLTRIEKVIDKRRDTLGRIPCRCASGVCRRFQSLIPQSPRGKPAFTGWFS